MSGGQTPLVEVTSQVLSGVWWWLCFPTPPRPRWPWEPPQLRVVVALQEYPEDTLDVPQRGQIQPWSCAALHRARVPSIPPSAGTTLGLGSWAVGTSLGSWLGIPFLPNPRGEAPVLPAKPFGAGKGPFPPSQPVGRGMRVHPLFLPGRCLSVWT